MFDLGSTEEEPELVECIEIADQSSMKTQATMNTHVNAGIDKMKKLGRNAYLACFRWFLGLVVMRLVPDFIVRYGIRYLLSLRLKEVRLIKVAHFIGIALAELKPVPFDVGCAATRKSAVEQDGFRG